MNGVISIAFFVFVLPSGSSGERSAPPLVVAITGASGAPYAVRCSSAARRAADAGLAHRFGARVATAGARRRDIADVNALQPRRRASGSEDACTLFDDGDRGASPASGSARRSGMVICPCSMGTLSAIAHGTSRSLVERAADVALKERRPLVLVPRETPLSDVHLENMLRLSRAGAVVLPASPGFYHRPAAIGDLVDFRRGAVLDQLDVEHDMARRWSFRSTFGRVLACGGGSLASCPTLTVWFARISSARSTASS